jgi:hypothetical protein
MNLFVLQSPIYCSHIIIFVLQVNIVLVVNRETLNKLMKRF